MTILDRTKKNRDSRLLRTAIIFVICAMPLILQGCSGEDNNNEDSNITPPSEEQVVKELKTQLTSDIEKDYLILVNKENGVDATYIPEDLTDVKYFAADRTSASRFLRKDAADAFHQMVEAAAQEGLELAMTTAYRGYEHQESLYNYYTSIDGANADTYSAKPGFSEHQTGLAVDVSSPSMNYQLGQDFGQTNEGIWMAENSYKYGLIIRFPEGKEGITGYMSEPWHLRYVGKIAAEEIYSKDITLEELIAELNK